VGSFFIIAGSLFKMSTLGISVSGFKRAAHLSERRIAGSRCQGTQVDCL
jgi:hypothetical protein